jgi:O-glycosyl hydrolase
MYLRDPNVTRLILRSGILVSFACTVLTASAQYTAIVNPAVQYQTLEGWGTSLSWFANGVGSWPEPVRSELIDSLFAAPPVGLGLTYARYNIGGGDCPSCKTIPYPHDVPGYQPAADAPYDWSADGSQRWVAQRAYTDGAVFLEAQSNSPPWWMTITGSSTGGVKGVPNISDAYTGSNKGSFADYLATVIGHFQSDYGLTFRAVEPTNEPDEAWWTYQSRKQEGCAFTPEEEQSVIKSLASLLPDRSPLTHVVAMDAYNLNHAFARLANYSTATTDAITEINTHTYAGNNRAELAAATAAAGKRMVMSEWGSSDMSGRDLSREITRDMTEMRPVDWAIWQPDWPGLVRVNYRAHTYSKNKAYYVFANYTHFIRPGFIFVSINDTRSLAAYDQRGQALTIVTMNWTSASQSVTYQLSNFHKMGTQAHGYRTSATQDLADAGTVAISNASFTAALPPNSVTSWVIADAVYAPRARSYNDSSFQYSESNCGKTWCSAKQKGAFRGDQHWSSQPGSYYTVTFTGTQARVYGSRGNDHGIAAFSVDGGAETDTDLYAASRADNQLIYATPSLVPGPHTLKVRVTGLRNANAKNVIVQADRVDVVP